MRRIVLLVLFFGVLECARPLTIVRDFIGGQQGPLDVGRGNLVDNFNAAADIWEQAIPEPHVLVLHYGWAPIGGGEHHLNAQGGVPHRETEGTIYFNNDADVGHVHFYLDPTPWENEEYSAFVEMEADYGGGLINAARYYTEPTDPDAASFSHPDLLMVALHEIGHALGLSMGNRRFIEDSSADIDIDVLAPLPLAGTTFRLQTNLFGVTSHLDIVYGNLMAGNNPRERRLPSAADILVNAQLSQFHRINLALAPQLAIERGGNELRISWREITRGFALEESSRLGMAVTWTRVAQEPLRTNGMRIVTLPRTDTNKFFRLRRPPQ